MARQGRAVPALALLDVVETALDNLDATVTGDAGGVHFVVSDLGSGAAVPVSVLEVPAPAAGVLGDIAAKDGETVAVGALLGQIRDGAAEPGKSTQGPAAAPPAAEAAPRPQTVAKPAGAAPLAPSVRKLAGETGIDVSTVA